MRQASLAPGSSQPAFFGPAFLFNACRIARNAILDLHHLLSISPSMLDGASNL
jgi:hypothetical protein